MDPVTPDERTLQNHLGDPVFRCQIDGLWGAPSLKWPWLFIWVRARPTDTGPDRYWLRIECSDYPQQAPKGTFWDMDTDCPLEHNRRPWGVGEVALVFRVDWPGVEYGGPGMAFYTPLDRIALATHADWAAKHAAMAWNSKRTLTDYLYEIACLLDSPEYTGLRGTIP